MKTWIIIVTLVATSFVRKGVYDWILCFAKYPESKMFNVNFQ